MPNGFSNTKSGKSLKSGTFKSKSYDGKTKRSTFSGRNVYGGKVNQTSGLSKGSSAPQRINTSKNRDPGKKVNMK